MQWTFSGDSLSAGKITLRVDLISGAVSFFDVAGKPILREKSDGRSVAAAAVQGENTFHVRQQWEPAEEVNQRSTAWASSSSACSISKEYDTLTSGSTTGPLSFQSLVSSKGMAFFGTTLLILVLATCGRSSRFLAASRARTTPGRISIASWQRGA